MTSDLCLLGNHLDRHQVFLVSFSSRTRQMDGEPETSRSSQQRQQQEAGERPDGVGHWSQRPARKEKVGALHTNLAYTLKSATPYTYTHTQHLPNNMSSNSTVLL